MRDYKGSGNTLYVISDIEDDMGSDSRMNLILQDDGDVLLSLIDKTGNRVSIEFCTPGMGGSRYPIIHKHLHNLITELVEEEERRKAGG